MYAVETASCGMIYLLDFTKIGRGVQAILGFASVILMPVMLVLLMEGIYQVRR
jgi:hypothetical protein